MQPFLQRPLYDYLRKSTLYEVNIRQYTEEGTLCAFMQHLPRLHEMGVDILWFMPIHPIGKLNRKGSLGSYYSVQDYKGFNPEFGTMDDFKQMVTEAHRLGMKVIIDWVANHTAWDHVWTKTNPAYFKRNEAGEFLSPYDWSDVIQIDHDNEEAHQAMRDAMAYWVKELDIDGFRADLAHLTPLRYWIKARKQCEDIKPNLIWLAETEDVHYFEAFDVAYAWKWMHQTEKMVKDHLPVHTMLEILRTQKHHYPSGALELFFTANHDENSWNGTEREKYGIYTDALTVFSFVYPWSLPLIYSGQELPNEKRLAFFDKDHLQWTDELHKEDLYKKMCKLRKEMNLTDDLHFQHVGEFVFSMTRGSSKKIWLVANFDHEEKEIMAEQFFINIPCKDVMSGEVIEVNHPFRLKPGGVRILQVQ